MMQLNQMEYDSEFSEDDCVIVVGKVILNEKDESTKDRFDNNNNTLLKPFFLQGWKDKWAAIAFISTISVSLLWGISLLWSGDTAFNKLHTHYSYHYCYWVMDTIIGDLQPVTLTISILLSIICSSLIAILALYLLEVIPRGMIICTSVILSLSAFITAIFTFIYGAMYPAVAFLILSLAHIIWIVCVRSRIGVAAIFLSNAARISRNYPALFFLTISKLFIFILYILWVACVFNAMLFRILNESPSTFDYIIIPFVIISVMWVTHVLLAISYVTTAGVVATWYFADDNNNNNISSTPTLSSFNQAITINFGSICFGALLNTIVGLIGWGCRLLCETSNEFLFSMLGFLHNASENLMIYHNSYSFVHVAVYGCSYLKASKQTCKLSHKCIFAAIYNDAIVSSTLRIMGIVFAGLTGISMGLLTSSLYIGIIVCIITLIEIMLVFRVVLSALRTLFVCFAEAPEALLLSSPKLYEELMNCDKGITTIHSWDEEKNLIV